MKTKKGRKSCPQRNKETEELTADVDSKQEKDPEVPEVEFNEHRLWEAFFFLVAALSVMTENFRSDAEQSGIPLRIEIAYYVQVFQMCSILYVAYGYANYRCRLADQQEARGNPSANA